jgi:hypothetical protein
VRGNVLRDQIAGEEARAHVVAVEKRKHGGA